MKQVVTKPQVNSAKKTAQKDIKLSLITTLKKVTAKFGKGSEKLEQEIEKGAKKLAKKIVKEIKLNDAAPSDSNQNSKTVKAPEKQDTPVAIKSVKAPAKPKAADPEKKITKTPVEAKPVAVKVAPVKKEKTGVKK